MREFTIVKQEKQEILQKQWAESLTFYKMEVFDTNTQPWRLFVTIPQKTGVTCGSNNHPYLHGSHPVWKMFEPLTLVPGLSTSCGEDKANLEKATFGGSQMGRSLRNAPQHPTHIPSLSLFKQIRNNKGWKLSTPPYYNCTMGTEPAGVFSSPREVGCLLPVHSLPQ